MRGSPGRLGAAGKEAELAWNPGFLREGHAVADARRPGWIVAGVASPRAEAILREVYERPLAEGVPLAVTDLATAELAPAAAHAFLATKISFINAMAEVCEAAGADVQVLAQALGHDPRIGAAGLQAGRAAWARELVAGGQLPGGYATEDGVGLHYVGTRLHEAVGILDGKQG